MTEITAKPAKRTKQAKRSNSSKPSKQLGQLTASSKEIKEGFRLHRVEVYNWGTFNNKVWTLDKEGDSTLLTGDNGSGKSTLVDALLTLLVPNKKRNYNLSSGSERRERSETSYVRGAYGREQNDFNQGQVKYLRDEDSYSVLLGTFKDEASQSTLVLCQLFWLDNKQLHKLYIASHDDISIATYFGRFTNIRSLRARLKKEASIELFNTFTDYELYFRQSVGLRTSKALDLFNQIVAIKEIGRLNHFVRDHMLDPIDINELLDQLYDNYQNLNLSHQAIVLAKNQLDALNPLVEMSESFQAVDEASTELEQQQAAVPLYFEEKKVEWLIAESDQVQQTLAAQKNELQQVDEQAAALQAHCSGLNVALNRDKAGQQLERFDLLIRQQKEKKQERQKQFKRYAALLKRLGLSAVENVDQFNGHLAQLGEEREQLDQQNSELRTKEYEAKRAAEREQRQLDGYAWRFESPPIGGNPYL